MLRPLFRRRRELLTELARAGAEAITELVRLSLGSAVRPGIVVSLATAGDLVQWHPHLHSLTSDGGFSPDGVMSLFRERLLARLLETHAISQPLVQTLLTWKHPGFSAHVGEPIGLEQRQKLVTLCGAA